MLEQQRRVLREAFEKASRYVVETQGDALLFTILQSAKRAAERSSNTARTYQAGLARWDAVKVRMALHTGQSVSERDGYVGLDVHRAARYCAAGHGG